MTTASARAEAAILDMIESGAIKPGEQIVHRTIARELGMSTIPVIEGLRRLEGMDLLDVVPGIGARVPEWTSGDLIDAYNLREGVEPVAARLCAERATADERAVLRVRLNEYVQAMADRDEEALARSDTRLHRQIAEGAHSPLIVRALRSSMHVLHSMHVVHLIGYQLLLVSHEHPGIVTHAETVEAIEQGNPAAAEAAMRRHICDARARFQTVVKNGLAKEALEAGTASAAMGSATE